MTEPSNFSNNLLDFDNFDPFAVSSIQKNSHHNETSVSSAFGHDPFGVDDWQHEMIGMGDSNNNKDQLLNSKDNESSGHKNSDRLNAFNGDGDDLFKMDNHDKITNEKEQFNEDSFSAKPYEFFIGDENQNNTSSDIANQAINPNNNNIFNAGFELNHSKTTTVQISNTPTTISSSATTTKAMTSNLDDLDDDWLNSVKAVQLKDATNSMNANDEEFKKKEDSQTAGNTASNNNKNNSSAAKKVTNTATTTTATNKYSNNKKKMDDYEDDDNKKFSVHNRYNNASNNLVIENNTTTTTTITHPTNDNNNNFDNDFEFGDSKPQSEKGLAGLKKMEHNIEDDFVVKPRSTQQQGSKNKETSQAAEKASAMIFNYSSSMDNICVQCNKRVYEMEKVTVDTIIYHKTCFRCVTCGRMLSLGNYSAMDGQMFCKADFMKNFKSKGKYTYSPESTIQRHASSEYDGDEDSSRGHIEEEVSGIPIKHMRNKFETKSQDGTNQQHITATSSASAASSSHSINSSSSYNKDDDVINRPTDVVVSSNVCIIEEELPPPSLAKNLRSMFETKEASKAATPPQPQARQQQLNKSKSRDSHGESYNQSPDVVNNRKISTSSSSSADRQQQRNNNSNVTPVSEPTNQRQQQLDFETTASTSPTTTEQHQKDELPPSGTARSLLERWRNIEETTVSRKSRGPSRSSTSSTSAASAAKRSQSSSRVEISQRLKIVEHDRPQINARRSRDEDDNDDGDEYQVNGYQGNQRGGDYDNSRSGDDNDLPPHMMARQRAEQFRELEQIRNATVSFVPKPKVVEETHKSFKWQVKEAVPLNRPCIVHGDTPKYLPVVGDVINEKTPISEIPKPRTSSSGGRYDNDGYDNGNSSLDGGGGVRDDVARGSYVTEIKEEELPDATAVKSAMLRFKSMEDPSKVPPLPKKAATTATPSSRYDPHLGPLQTYGQNKTNTSSFQTSNTRNSREYDDNVYDDDDDGGDDNFHHQQQHGDNEDEDDGYHHQHQQNDGGADNDEDLPASGTTRNLMAKFQSFN